METYFSKIPLDLLALVSSQLTIEKIDELCSAMNLCNPSFWDALYRIKFNGRPPENSEKWFSERLGEYRHYLIAGYPNPAINMMAKSGMINEVQTILNHINLDHYQVRDVLYNAAKGGHRNIIDLIFELYTSELDDAIYEYAFYGAIEGGHKDLMDFFRSLMKNDPDYDGSTWYASRGGNLEMFKKIIEHSIDIISPRWLRMIIVELIRHEDLFYWFIKKYPDKLSTLSHKDYVYLIEFPAFDGNIKILDTLLNISNQEFSPGDYIMAMESAIHGGHEKMIKKLLSLGAGKSKWGYARWMIYAAENNKYDIFIWMCYLGKDQIKKEDYQTAFNKTSNEKIKEIIIIYSLV